MNPLFGAAVEVERFCVEQEWEFCFIGALAVIRWGEPRLTRDVDLTILTGFGGEERYTAGAIPVDVALGAMPFEERAVRRATPWTLTGGASVRTCSAEDLVVFKTFAGRDQDWLDVESIVCRQGARLDTGLIVDELGPLVGLKGTPEDLDRLQRILAA